MADDTDCKQFDDVNITLDAHMNLSATVMGFPSTTSGNAKRNLLLDKLTQRCNRIH